MSASSVTSVGSLPVPQRPPCPGLWDGDASPVAHRTEPRASASEHDPRDPVHVARAECFGLVGKVKAQAVEELKRLREPIPAEELELAKFPLAVKSHRAKCIDGMW